LVPRRGYGVVKSNENSKDAELVGGFPFDRLGFLFIVWFERTFVGQSAASGMYFVGPTVVCDSRDLSRRLSTFATHSLLGLV
jgi:hypothetical protein